MKNSEFKKLQEQIEKLQQSVDALPKWQNFEDLLLRLGNAKPLSLQGILDNIAANICTDRQISRMMRYRDDEIDKYFEACKAAYRLVGHKLEKENKSKEKIRVRKVASKRIKS